MITLQEGRYYYNREGDVVGPIVAREMLGSKSKYIWTTGLKPPNPHAGWVYRPDGRVFDDEENDRDLVAEVHPPEEIFTPAYKGEWEDAE